MKMSVGMLCIQTGRPLTLWPFLFLPAETSRMVPMQGHRPVQAWASGPARSPAGRRPPSPRAPPQVLSPCVLRHRRPCGAQAPTTLHTLMTAFLVGQHHTALSCCPWLPKRGSLVATQTQPRRTGALTPLGHLPGPVGSRGNIAGVW